MLNELIQRNRETFDKNEPKQRRFDGARFDFGAYLMTNDDVNCCIWGRFQTNFQVVGLTTASK